MNPLYENKDGTLHRCPACGGSPGGLSLACATCWPRFQDQLIGSKASPSADRARLFALGDWAKTRDTTGLIDEDPPETDLAFLLFATDPEIERKLFGVGGEKALNDNRLALTRKAWELGAKIDSFEGKRR